MEGRMEEGQPAMLCVDLTLPCPVSANTSDLNSGQEHQKVAAKCKLTILIKICTKQSGPHC